MNIFKKILQLNSLLLSLSIFLYSFAAIIIYFNQYYYSKINIFCIFLITLFFIAFHSRKNILWLIIAVLLGFYIQHFTISKLKVYDYSLANTGIYKKFEYQICGKIDRFDIIDFHTAKLTLKNVSINNKYVSLNLQVSINDITNFQKLVNSDYIEFNTRIGLVKSDTKFKFINNAYRNLLGYTNIEFHKINIQAYNNNFAAALKYKTFINTAKCIPFPYNNIFFAILTGNINVLEDSVLEAFRAAGITHILAISGLHIGIIAAIFILIFKIFGRNWKYLVSMIGVWLFVGWVNLPPSAVRAAIMFTIYCGGKIYFKKIFLPNVLLICFILFVLFEPLIIFQIGFQLSFCAVAGIATGLEISKKIKNIFLKSIIICLMIQLFTLPLASYHFGLIPVAGFILNIFAPFLLGLALPTGILTLLISIIYVSIARISGMFTAGILDVIVRLTDLFPNLNIKNYIEYKFSFKELILYYSILLFVGIFFSMSVKAKNQKNNK